MGAMRELEPEVAAARFVREPENIWFPVHTMPHDFGLSWEEVRGELISGRLVASGRSIPGGYSDVAVQGTALLAWLGNAATPPALITKMMTHWRALSTLPAESGAGSPSEASASAPAPDDLQKDPSP